MTLRKIDNPKFISLDDRTEMHDAVLLKNKEKKLKKKKKFKLKKEVWEYQLLDEYETEYWDENYFQIKIEEPYNCEVCNMLFFNKDDLEKHMNENTNNSYKKDKVKDEHLHEKENKKIKSFILVNFYILVTNV